MTIPDYNAYIIEVDGVKKAVLPGFARTEHGDVVYIPYSVNTHFQQLYAPLHGMTAVTQAAAWRIYNAAWQCASLPGCFVECGVDRGGSARFLADLLAGSGKILHLFDTFEGMPPCDSLLDFHEEGDFVPPGIEAVQAFVGHPDFTVWHKGRIPETFEHDMDWTFAFAHIDVDSYQSVFDCCEFIYPRMSKGGIMIFDDYGYPTCQGAILAVDTFFADKPERPLDFITGGAVVFKL